MENKEILKKIRKELVSARSDKTSCKLCEKSEVGYMTEFEHVDHHVDEALRLIDQLLE